jgi:UDP-glucose 4-epimerase
VAGQPCPLYGDGSQTRDFVFVDDVVDALARAADHGDGLLLNIGTGVGTSLTALHGLLVRAAAASGIAATGPLVPSPARAGDVRRSSLDPTRAGIHLDWRPWTTLEQGLSAVLTDALERRGPGAVEGGDVESEPPDE